MAFVAQSLGKLQGFVLALLGELDWQDDHSLIYEDSIPGTKEDHATGVELCVLSYQRDDFGTFVESAARAAEFHDWEIDTGFMVSQSHTLCTSPDVLSNSATAWPSRQHGQWPRHDTT